MSLRDRVHGLWDVAHGINAALLEQIEKDLGRLYGEAVWKAERFGGHAARMVGLWLSHAARVRQESAARSVKQRNVLSRFVKR